MKIFKWLIALSLIASVAYSGRELLAVARLANNLSAAPHGAAPAEQPAMAKAVSAEMSNLDLASKIADMDGSVATSAGPTSGGTGDVQPVNGPVTRAIYPQPEHAGAADTNSAPGKIFKAKGGRNKAAITGGAVIIDANGNRLELAPVDRPKPSVAARAIKSLSKVEIPSLDDPHASLQARKIRAELALGACALAAVILALWARKYRLD